MGKYKKELLERIPVSQRWLKPSSIPIFLVPYWWPGFLRFDMLFTLLMNTQDIYLFNLLCKKVTLFSRLRSSRHRRGALKISSVTTMIVSA